MNPYQPREPHSDKEIEDQWAEFTTFPGSIKTKDLAELIPSNRYIYSLSEDENGYKTYTAKRIYGFIETTVNIGAPKGMLTIDINGKQVQLVVHVKELK